MTLPLLVGAIAFVVGGHENSPRIDVRKIRVAAPNIATVQVTTRTVSHELDPRARFGVPIVNVPVHWETTADSLVVEKSLRRMTLFYRGTPIRTFYVALGRNPVGRKERAGDNRTPEGLYYIDLKNDRSKYHVGLHVSYPSVDDRVRAAAHGVSPGGDIMVHGLPHGFEKIGAAHRLDDWTEGCIALTNDEAEEVFRAVPVGTPIEIKP